MTLTEKESLLSQLSLPTKWCKDAEGRDSVGECVSYDDPAAVAWDLTGALYLLFGWNRAAELFPQIARHILDIRPLAHGPNAAVAAMVALQEFNDHPDTTYDLLIAQLQSQPASAGGPRKTTSVSNTHLLSQGDQYVSSD